jgi:hypothetical protein
MEVILWIDLVNEQIHKGKWSFLTHVSAISSNYKNAFKAASKAIKYAPYVLYMDRKSPGRSMHIYQEERKHFLTLFKRFYRAPKDTSKSRKYRNKKFQKRSKNLLPTDILLNDRFFEKHGMKLNQMTDSQQAKFEELKDMIHEEYFGKMSRFDKHAHQWISNDKEMVKSFVVDLLREYTNIINTEEIYLGRYQRKFIVEEDELDDYRDRL